MKKTITLLLLISFLSSLNARGIEGVYEVIVRKQEEKKASRWTLADWMFTKQKMSLMDQWLALHSSSTYFEFFLEGSGGMLDGRSSLESTNKSKTSYRYQTALYLRAIGIQAGIDKFSGYQDSSFFQGNLILLGSSAQSTNIQFHYGKRNLTTKYGEFGPSYWGASGTLYLLPFFGGLYEYRNYSDDDSGSSRFNDGQRQEYGAFLDIWFLRIRGTYFKERANYTTTANATIDQTISGWWFGGQLFF